MRFFWKEWGMGRYVIVGNGVAGTRAAEVLRRKEPGAEITLVTEEAFPFYRRPQLADYAAGFAGGARLWGKRNEFYDQHGLQLKLGARAEGVDAAAGKVFLANGDSLPYDRLLVATGRSLRTPGIPGADLQGINYFKTLNHAQQIRDLEGDDRTAVVYGDGLVALEMVRGLTGAGVKTTYIVPGERLWPEVLDEDAGMIAASRVRAAGAEIVYGQNLAAVEGQDGFAEGLRLSGGETIRADVVGVCSDYAADLGFLPGEGNDFSVGPDLATPWEGIYAAGDCTVSEGVYYFNWLRSWRQGAAAGAALAGESLQAPTETQILNMQVLGLSLVALGQTNVAYRSGYTQMRGDYPVGEFYKKLVFDPDGVLVGALLMGSIAEAGALEEAIGSGRRKDDLEPALLHQMFDVTYRTAYLGVQCPVCRHEIQVARGAGEGDLITCPVCGVDFNLVPASQGYVARIASSV
jgi:NAD(P)H-nitrite reductase large subunit